MNFAIRDKLIARCKIDKVEFIAAACSGGGKRRLVGGGSIGVDGEDFEDLGENARTEQIKATVDEQTYLELDSVRRAAKPVVCTHPLFGVIWARLSDLSYDADEKQGVNISITLVEDGDVSVFLNVNATSFPQASGAAGAAADAFAEGLDDLDDLDDFGGEFLSVVENCGDLVDAFTDALEVAGEGGLAAVQALSGAFGELVDGVDSMLEQFDTAAASFASLIDSDLPDLAYALVDAGRVAVDALVSASTTVWQPLQTSAPMGLDAVALEFLGSSDDDAIDRILSANPELIDLIALPPGVTVWLPV